MTAGFACATCGTELRATAKFCDECGSPLAAAPPPAEYKQVLRMPPVEVRTRGDEATYRDYRDRYRAMAKSLDFKGHMAWAGELE